VDNDSLNDSFLIRVNNGPGIGLVSPENGYTSSSSITFSYEASDWDGVENCSLYVNEVFQEANDNISVGENYFVKSFNEGNYEWQIKCFDSYGNLGNSSVYNFNIHYIGGSSSGSSGGGWGGNPSIQLNTTNKTIEEIAGEKEKINFEFDGVNYNLTIDKVLESKVECNIEKLGINFELNIEESREIDLNGDEINDVIIKLEYIKNGSAKIEIEKIEENENRFRINRHAVEGGEFSDIIKNKFWLFSAVIFALIVLVVFTRVLINRKNLKKKEPADDLYYPTYTNQFYQRN
jgi:hypothetical protein